MLVLTHISVDLTNDQFPDELLSINAIDHVFGTVKGTLLIFVQFSNAQGALIRSTDNLATWSIVKTWVTPDSASQGRFTAIAGSSLVFLTVQRGVSFPLGVQYLSSSDDGLTWNELSNPPKTAREDTHVYLEAAGPGILALGSRGYLSFSTTGDSWSSPQRGIYGEIPGLISAESAAPVSFAVVASDGLFGSADGLSWQRLATNSVQFLSKSKLPAISWIAADATHPSNITVSSDLRTWRTLPGPSAYSLNSLACATTVCVAGVTAVGSNWRNVWFYSNSDPINQNWRQATTPLVSYWRPSLAALAGGNDNAFVALVYNGSDAALLAPTRGISSGQWDYVGPNVQLNKASSNCLLKFAGPEFSPSQNLNGWFFLVCGTQSSWISSDGLNWSTFNPPLERVYGISHVANIPGPQGTYIFSGFGIVVTSTDGLKSWSAPIKTPTTSTYYDYVAVNAAGTAVFASSGDNSIYAQSR